MTKYFRIAKEDLINEKSRIDDLIKYMLSKRELYGSGGDIIYSIFDMFRDWKNEGLSFDYVQGRFNELSGINDSLSKKDKKFIDDLVEEE